MARSKGPLGATKKPNDSIANFGGHGGNGKPSDNYSFKEEQGRLKLVRDGVTKPVADFSPTGTVISDEVTTGVGSFKLGNIHSVSSAGKAVVFTSSLTETTIIPLAAKFIRHGKEIEEPFQPLFSESKEIEPLGAVNPDPSAVIQSIWNFSTQLQGAIMAITIMPEEDYVGPVVLSVYDDTQAFEIYRSGGKMLLTKGEPCLCMLDIPCFLDDRKVLVSLNKEIASSDPVKVGTTYEESISCRASANNADAPWVRLLVRPYVKETLIRRSDLTASCNLYVSDLTDKPIENVRDLIVYINSTAGDAVQLEPVAFKDKFSHFTISSVMANGYYSLYVPNDGTGNTAYGASYFLTKPGECTTLTCDSLTARDERGNLPCTYSSANGDDVASHMQDANRHLSKEDRGKLDSAIGGNGKVTIRFEDKKLREAVKTIQLHAIDDLEYPEIDLLEIEPGLWRTDYAYIGTYRVVLFDEKHGEITDLDLSDVILTITPGAVVEVIRNNEHWEPKGMKCLAAHMHRQNPLHVNREDRRWMDDAKNLFTISCEQGALCQDWFNIVLVPMEGNNPTMHFEKVPDVWRWEIKDIPSCAYSISILDNKGTSLFPEFDRIFTVSGGSHIDLVYTTMRTFELQGNGAMLSDHIANVRGEHLYPGMIVQAETIGEMGASEKQIPSCKTVNAVINNLPVYSTYISDSYTTDGLAFSCFTMRDPRDKYCKMVLSVGAGVVNRNVAYKMKLPVFVSMSDSWVVTSIQTSTSLGGVQQNVYAHLQANSAGSPNIGTDLGFTIVSATPGVVAASGRIQFIVEGKRA